MKTDFEAKNAVCAEIAQINHTLATLNADFQRLSVLDGLTTPQLEALCEQTKNFLQAAKTHQQQMQKSQTTITYQQQARDEKYKQAWLLAAPVLSICTALGVVSALHTQLTPTNSVLMLSLPVWGAGSFIYKNNFWQKHRAQKAQNGLQKHIAKCASNLEDLELVLQYRQSGKSLAQDFAAKIQDANVAKQSALTMLRNMGQQYHQR